MATESAIKHRRAKRRERGMKKAEKKRAEFFRYERRELRDRAA